MAVFIPSLIISGALLIASAFLLRKPKGKSVQEDSITQISTRGSWVPVSFGTRKSEVVLIGWAGDRTTKKKSSGGGGLFGRGGGGVTSVTFFEKTWHLLGVGPATILHEIRFDGKIVWQGPIDSATSPSGTEVNIGNDGTFRIYWGEADQPINFDLGDSNRVGVSSRWPRLCYVYWTKLRYGASPRQPQVEYVLTFACQGITLGGSTFLIGTGMGGGVNPAHIAHALLTSGPFTGANLPLSAIDKDSLEAWGLLAQNEALAANVVYTDGETADTALSALLQDSGFLMPQVGGRLAFLATRFKDPVGFPVPVLSDDMVSPPDMEKIINLSPEGITRPVFTFKSEEGFNFRDQDIPFSDDGLVDEAGVPNAEKVEITTATDIIVASKIARRRWQESAIDTSAKLRVMRGARLLLPGQTFIRPGFGQFRVTGTQWSEESPVTSLSCILDSFAVREIDDVFNLFGVGPDLRTPVPDIDFTFFEMPTSLQSGSTIEILVFRIRAHTLVGVAGIFVSTDGVTFDELAQQTANPGGTLAQAMSATPATGTVSVGPRFTPDNDDISDVLDLSADKTSWQAGRQVALIGNEVFFVKRFDAVDEVAWKKSTAKSVGAFVRPTGPVPALRFEATTAGTTGPQEPKWPSRAGETVNDNGIVWSAKRFDFIPRDMIRARFGTVAQAHSIGDRIFIADMDDASTITRSVFQAGQTVCIKTQPHTAGGVVSLASVVAVCKTLLGDPLGEMFLTSDLGLRTDDLGNPRIVK